MASCGDYLTLVPLNDVVLENFWTEKADVESVLLGAYAALETSDCIIRMSMWGEMRSDNIVAGTSTPNDILQITKDNILQTNSYTSWKCFYDVINRANTVIYYAPQVQALDPNYQESELLSNLAEAKALRDLCYFYLIRAYKDVPYVTRPSIDDEESFVVEASSFDYILDQLIADLDAVKEDACDKYQKEEANTGRITRVAIYAMLADMYLWDQNWDKCIECCEKVIELKDKDYKELKEEEGADCTVDYFKGIPLIKPTTGSKNAGNSYNEIFGTGNSFESLFELTFMTNQSTKNSFVSSYYGDRNTTVGYLAANSELFMNVPGGTNAVFPKYDGRYLEDMIESSSNYGIRKYVVQSTSYDLVSASASDPKAEFTSRSDNSPANWIIYRLSDVVLMEAEALVQKAAQNEAEKDALFQQAFQRVLATNNRAINYPTNGDTLKYTLYSGSVKTMEELVLLERRRELLFEGKRWFDLQRVCQRDGDTKRLITWVITKYTENVSAVRIKLADMDAIYFPISKDELKINPLLSQNPAYVEDEYTSKSE